MKKLILIIGSILFLTACSTSAGEAPVEKTEIPRFDPDGRYSIVTDTETGCKYLVSGGSGKYRGGITSLLKPNGEPDGCYDID